MTDKVQKIREEVERLHGNPYYMMAVKDALAIIDSLQEEPVSEDLEKAAEKAAVETFFVSPQWTEIRKELFKAGAKWQEKQDQKTIELAEDHAMLAGMEKIREQMMKDAVEAKVIPADLDETQFCLSDYD